MAEETPAPTTTVEISPMAEEVANPTEESPPNGAAVPQEEEADPKETQSESPESKAASPTAAEHKRKLSDLEVEEEKKDDESKAHAEGGEKAGEVESKVADLDAEVGDAKRQRVDGDADVSGVDGDLLVEKVEDIPVGNGQLPLTDSENIQSGPVVQNSTDGIAQQGVLPTTEQETASRKIDIPNNKVGVLIGKAGETIRLLQNSSGAKIQITRDGEADPNSSTRPVELVGTLENINKAAELIKSVMAEADAGGSPALVARGYSATQSGSEEFEMQVPNEKVGQIIGKGGETIKRLQAESHARIQLIPQHLPEGEVQKERTVRITGNKKQIEVAKDKIKDVMNQTGRPSNFSGGHNQNYRPRGSGGQSQWGPRGPASGQSHPPPNVAYDYSQRGSYPQATQYPQQSYGSSYPQQPPMRNNFSSGWEQRPAAPVQTGGYDYYAQGGQTMGAQPSNPLPAPVNYNYGQPPATGYNQPNPYPQSGPQQGYGGYNEPKYDNQAPSQQIYGQQPQPTSNQQGFYPQQGSTQQTGYSQQPSYGKPPAAAAAYAGVPQSYGPPRPTQPGDQMYQGSAPSSYGTGGPSQQPYPYNSSAPSPQPAAAAAAAAYGQSYGPPPDGYNQPLAGYAQPNNQVTPNYGQVGQGYAQPAAAQTGGYGQYPSGGQPAAYGEPAAAAASNVNYGYQGAPADAGYGSAAPVAGYGAAPAGQPGYVQVAGGYPQQAPASAAGYDQSMAAPPQAGYGGYPGNPAAGYAKGVSPQPAGYSGQY